MPKRTKRLRGGSNKTSRAKSLKKSSNRASPSRREQPSRSKSKLRVNSKKRYKFKLTIRGTELVGDEEQRGKFSVQSFRLSDIKKVIETETHAVEKLNDIITQLNTVLDEQTKTDRVQWDIVETLKSDPKIYEVFENPLRYTFLNTRMRFTKGKGEIAILEVNEL
jgi:hypothetical protein